MPAEAPPADGRFDEVLKIAVLRGGGLGDLLFALPALDALAEAYPEAEIVLLGTPMHAALLRGRPGPVARVEVLPKTRGVHGGEHEDDPRATGAFMRRMRAEGFDLACQMHGGGRYSNPFLLALGARHTVGTAPPDAAPLERTLPYVYYQHEVVRRLETVALAGAPSVGPEPTLAVTPAERRRGRELTLAALCLQHAPHRGHGGVRGGLVVRLIAHDHAERRIVLRREAREGDGELGHAARGGDQDVDERCGRRGGRGPRAGRAARGHSAARDGAADGGGGVERVLAGRLERRDEIVGGAVLPRAGDEILLARRVVDAAEVLLQLDGRGVVGHDRSSRDRTRPC